MEKGELGLAALPDRIQDFRMQLEMSIEYANCLRCKRYHMFLAIRKVCVSFQNNPRNLDPSYKKDLGLWDCLGRVKLIL